MRNSVLPGVDGFSGELLTSPAVWWWRDGAAWWLDFPLAAAAAARRLYGSGERQEERKGDGISTNEGKKCWRKKVKMGSAAVFFVF